MTPTAEGGRRGFIGRRYHAMCWIGHMAGDHKIFNDAIMLLADQEQVAPGEAARAYLSPLEPRFWSSVEVGDEIELWEGLSLFVGRATVVGVM